MIFKRPLLLVVAMLCVAGLAACGGGDDGNSKSEVVTKANEICSSAEQQARAYADDRDPPQSPEEVNAALSEDARIAQEASDKLDELEPPDEDKESFDTFVVSEQKSAGLYKTQVEASKSGNNEQFLTSSEELLDKTDDAKKSAEAYGLTDCPYRPVAVFFARESDSGNQDSGTTDNSDASGESNSDATLGQWIGRVTQYGPGNKTYRYNVHMNINQLKPGAVAGTIRYPDIPCTGQLQLSRQSGDRSVFKERITGGTSRCDVAGTIVTTVSGERLSWRWVGRLNGKPVEVLGSLQQRS